jgi:spore maturation protein CgeB
MNKKYLFIVDGNVQSSLFKPWERAFIQREVKIEYFNFEESFQTINFFFRSKSLLKVYNWSRRSQHSHFLQNIACTMLRPFYLLIITKLNNILKNKVNNNYDLVLVFKGLDLKPSTLEYFNNKDIKTVCLNGDSPFNMQSSNYNLIECIPKYDVFLCWSKEDHLKMQKHGYTNTYVLPFSCEGTSNLEEFSIEYDLDDSIIFIGAWDKKREELLDKISYENLIIFGPNWNKANKSFIAKKKIYSRRLTLEQMAFIYDKSLCGLNILREQNINSHNMKTFEITGMGCYMIAPDTNDHRLFFDKDDSVELFKNPSEIDEKVRKIKSLSKDISFKKRNRTKIKVLQNHSYISRAEQLQNIFLGKIK